MKKAKTRRREVRKRLKRIQIWRSLTISDLYDMYAIVSDEDMKKQIESRILGMASGDDELLNVIRNEVDPLRKMAWEKLQDRIKKGYLKRSHARKILIDIFKKVIELRLEVWGIIKSLYPTAKELQDILDQECMRDMPVVRHQAEQLIRKRHIRRPLPVRRAIKRIKELS